MDTTQHKSSVIGRWRKLGGYRWAIITGIVITLITAIVLAWTLFIDSGVRGEDANPTPEVSSSAEVDPTPHATEDRLSKEEQQRQEEEQRKQAESRKKAGDRDGNADGAEGSIAAKKKGKQAAAQGTDSAEAKKRKQAAEARQRAAKSKGSVTIEQLGIKAPLKTIAPKNGIVDPPDKGTSYWLVEGYGEPSASSDRNVYIVVHSGYMRYGGALGDQMVNTKTKKSTVKKGSVIGVDGVQYRVSDSKRWSKGGYSDMDIWESPKDGKQRLYVITCLQRPGVGSSVDLIVNYAERI